MIARLRSWTSSEVEALLERRRFFVPRNGATPRFVACCALIIVQSMDADPTRLDLTRHSGSS
jgi:hypothetical protein